MNLTVNGAACEIDGSALTPLLDVLRDELGVTGPKAGCHQGGCGACTVLVDGEPRRSCLMPAGYAEGAEIVTVEGIGAPEDLAPIQTDVPISRPMPTSQIHTPSLTGPSDPSLMPPGDGSR